MNALQRLSRTQLPVKVSYSLKKIIDGLESKKKDIKREWYQILEMYVVFKDGEPQVSEDKMSYLFRENRSQEDLNRAEPEFSERTFELDRIPIHYSQLGDIQIAPVDVSFLDGIVQFEDVIPEGGNVIPLHRKGGAPAPSPETPA